MGLKEWRESRGISRYALGKATDLKDGTLQTIENRTSVPSTLTALILLHYAAQHGGGLSLEDLLPDDARERLDAARARIAGQVDVG